MFRILAPLAALLCLAPPAHAGKEELRLAPNGHYMTMAEINSARIEVLVDTGASTVALGQRDAQLAGLRPRTLRYDVPVSTANGNVMAAKVKIRRIAIGRVRVENVEGIVLPEGALSGTLLGMSFLSKLDGFAVKDGVLILKD